MTRFVHLRLHTEYSLVDSVVRIASEYGDDGKRTVLGVMDAVAEAGMPAVALTDQSNLFAMVKFYRAAQSRGVKPLIGVDAWIKDATDERAEPTRLTLLCQNSLGYRSLTQLVSRSYLEGRKDDAKAQLAAWQSLLGDRYYLELSRTGKENEEEHIAGALELAIEFGVPVVATNDVRFIAPDDFPAHEARVCIHEGTLLDDPGRPRRYTAQQYLRTPAEMVELFADIPEAIENTIGIAERCSLDLKLGKSVLPAYPVPEGMTTEDFLRVEAEKGLGKRLEHFAAHPVPGVRVIPAEEYPRRLALELDVICQMGFAGYFLIVADFIRWSRGNGVPVGPGRGSGAGSLVAYSLGITDLDPLQYDLLFERFLNPERVSMPDFDVDFCMDGRDRVIDYVAHRYGRERVSQIITYGSMAAKAVVRDVARVMGMSYGFADSIAKLIPFELGITLKGALEKEPELKRRYDNEDETREVIDLALALEGLVRNAGMHAGGVVIAPSLITDFSPLYCDENGGSLVTQFDKDDVEAAGLVKFDFLGLRTLTIIDWALKTINRQRELQGEPPLDINTLPMNDAATYQLLQRGDTTAVFQLESRGMKDLIRRLQPDCFEDIVALVALFRPGPLQSGMVDDFIARKKADRGAPGAGIIDYLHPDLKPVLAPTYGVILYQEQVMQIAQVLAGYTLGGADLLRRAMGKKKPEEMAKQRSVFVEGATGRGVDPAVSAYIFDLMEKFAGYGFNKSHSAAYAVLSYQTAWLKTHYPAAFMAAVLSSDMDKTDKVVTLKHECDKMGLKVEPPDVNASRYKFAVSGERSIRYGLGAIKGVGESVVDALIAEREANGPYTSLVDFCRRSDLGKLNRRVFEALIRCGALDSLGPNRATLMHELPTALQLADQSLRARAVGQNDMFGLATPAAAVAVQQVEVRPEWSRRVRLEGERDTLGLYLTGHPIDEYATELKVLTSGRIADVAGERPTVVPTEGFRFRGTPATVAGLVLEVRKRGNRTTCVLDDGSARLEVSLFEETFEQYRAILAKDAVLIVEGSLRFDEFIEDWRLTPKRIVDIDQAREQLARRLIIRWPEASRSPAAGRTFLAALEAILKPCRPGSCGVTVHYQGEGARAVLPFADSWNVHPNRDMIEKLRQLVGEDGVRLIYPPPER
jgi:DNA polymerase-3 subunit alpha